jgi:hypothetical protein
MPSLYKRIIEPNALNCNFTVLFFFVVPNHSRTIWLPTKLYPAIQPGTSKGNLLHELLQQVTDTKVPTAKQIAGERYGQQKVKEEAQQRAQRPRGLIEYGVRELSPR